MMGNEKDIDLEEFDQYCDCEGFFLFLLKLNFSEGWSVLLPTLAESGSGESSHSRCVQD